MRGRAAALLWLALILVTTVILMIVLWPSRPAGESQDGLLNWVEQAHLTWLPDFVTFSRIEWSANVLMFIPLGFLGGLLIARSWALLGATVLLSVLVESAQHFLLAQRVGSVGDVLANALGALVGLAFASAVLRSGRRPRPSRLLPA